MPDNYFLPDDEIHIKTASGARCYDYALGGDR